MREHCRTQHSYDPFPTPDKQQVTGFSKGMDALAEACQKVEQTLRNSLRLKELETGSSSDKALQSTVGNSASAINYLLNNFVILEKRKVKGISGHVCEKCLTFHFSYVADLVSDPPISQKHRCLKRRLEIVNQITKKKSLLKQIYEESVGQVMDLIDVIFPGEKILRARRIDTISIYNAPQFSPGFFTEDKWLWEAIKKGQAMLKESEVKTIVKEVMGSYGIIDFGPGDSLRYVFVNITNSKRLGLKLPY
jgi:hypothetical protein